MKPAQAAIKKIATCVVSTGQRSGNDLDYASKLLAADVDAKAQFLQAGKKLLTALPSAAELRPAHCGAHIGWNEKTSARASQS